MPVIYLDVLIVLNMFIDFLLLSVTARILRIPFNKKRLVIGALLGGACSCLIFIPDAYSLLLFLLKISSAFLIIRVSFRWQSILLYIKQFVVFLISSALFGGIAFAIWFFAAPAGFYVVNGIVYYNVSPILLTILTVISYIVICIYDRLTHKKIADNDDFHLRIDCENGTADLRALYDTGHHVTDVFSGSPVIIVDLQAIKPYLSGDLSSSIENALSLNHETLQKDSSSIAVQNKLRMIPFRTVKGTGLLPAYRPSHITLLSSKNTSTDITGTFVAFSNHIARGEYQAIIGTDIVNLLEGRKINCKR